jgi:hypothetical protein
MPATELDPGFLTLVRWAHAKLDRARTEAICTPQDMTEALNALVSRGILKHSVKNGKRLRGLNVDQNEELFRARMKDITEPEMIALCAFITTAGARAGIFPPWPVPAEMVERLRRSH